MKEIHAKSCDVVDLSDEEYAVESFLNKNHKQGHTAFIKAYGLCYGDKLVQILTFGRPRFNKWFQWELLRDCIDKDYVVCEGVSRLWSEFLENNSVRSCICYSYPHDEDELYTNKYVEHCGFKNIKKAKPTKRVYFEGMWNGELKRIDKSILERHGVDRLLKTKQGTDRTNEQILLDLGFKKKVEDGFEPQVDSYFPFGLVYKITDLDTGKFYIGKCEIEDKWINGYLGSGREWVEHCEKYPNHNFKREVLKDGFTTPKELYQQEVDEIHKYCIELDNGNYRVDRSTGCMNVRTNEQSELPLCPECGGVLFHHYKFCSMYTEPRRCPICESTYGHLKRCTKYRRNKVCEECNGLDGKHRKGCSQYVEKRQCEECNGLNGNHRKGCSRYIEFALPCNECGGRRGHHYKECSKYIDMVCAECGGHDKKHKKGCSKYTERKICEECGGGSNSHFKTCSKYKVHSSCSECGGIGSHKKICSKYYVIPCEECGGERTHRRTCSKYKQPKPCSECGKTGRARHKPWCSKYR